MQKSFLLLILGVCLSVILILSIKLYLIRRSADEIKDTFAERLKNETNTLIDISGNDAHMRALASSINEELKALRTLRHKFWQGDLEVKDAITGVSHDLRTPLTSISGYLNLLKQEELSTKARQYLAVIEERTDTLKNLTEELFDYSVFTSSSEEPDLEELCLNHQLEESLSAYYVVLKGCQITPEISIPEEKVMRKLNRRLLSRIFENIISNAIKYSDGDFFVTLTSDGSMTFSNHTSRLDAIQVGQLFHRFYTVENAKTSTGLGLNIAKLLTEQMGGTIRAEYEDGMIRVILKFHSPPDRSL